MTTQQAIEWVQSHDDDDQLDDDDLVDAYAALYGRQPDAHDRDEGLWSHCCAAADDVEPEQGDPEKAIVI